MEDSPAFNAGYGAALTERRLIHELDASIMNGATLGAGARVRGVGACAIRSAPPAP